jgi:hypothetical protein
MSDVRHAHGAERLLLQVHQLREYERLLLSPFHWHEHQRRGKCTCVSDDSLRRCFFRNSDSLNLGVPTTIRR